MASKRGTEQAILWLRSKAAERYSLDAINAELCLNIIRDLQEQLNRKGAIIHNLKMKEEKTECVPYGEIQLLYNDGTEP